MKTTKRNAKKETERWASIPAEIMALSLEIADYQFDNMPQKRIESDRVADEAIRKMVDGEWF